MIVISNASPIIALYNVEVLDVLQKLYKEIIVSSEVFVEITGKTEKPGSVEIAQIIVVESVKSVRSVGSVNGQN